MNLVKVYLDHSALLTLFSYDTIDAVQNQEKFERFSKELSTGSLKPVTSLVSIKECFDFLERNTRDVSVDFESLFESLMELCDLYSLDNKQMSRAFHIMQKHKMPSLYALQISFSFRNDIQSILSIVEEEYKDIEGVPFY